MRLAILLASLVCVASASAARGVYVPYPANPQDAALLARGPTAQEKLAESVAGRLDRKSVV